MNEKPSFFAELQRRHVYKVYALRREPDPIAWMERAWTSRDRAGRLPTSTDAKAMP